MFDLFFFKGYCKEFVENNYTKNAHEKHNNFICIFN